MIRLVVLLLAFEGLMADPDDLFLGEDKAKHFLVSACMTGMLSYALYRNPHSGVDRPLLAGCSITLGMGVLKEIRDSRQKSNHFCFKDLFWDMAGISIGAFNMRMLPSL
jgi:uncharacterized protein YfiM (DUF2279 family)